MCQECWSTTEAFHELYRKSQRAQAKFLGSVVKVESETTDLTAFDHVDIDREFYEEQPFDISDLKMEVVPEPETATGRIIIKLKISVLKIIISNDFMYIQKKLTITLRQNQTFTMITSLM